MTYAGDVDFGATPRSTAMSPTDFLRCGCAGSTAGCKGVDNGVDSEPRGAHLRHGRRVRAGGTPTGRLDHGGRWRAAADWPLPETAVTHYYLHARRWALARARRTTERRPLTYDYDPAKPVPTIGGAITSGAPVMEGGAYDQREAASASSAATRRTCRWRPARRPGLPDRSRWTRISW